MTRKPAMTISFEVGEDAIGGKYHPDLTLYGNAWNAVDGKHPTYFNVEATFSDGHKERLKMIPNEDYDGVSWISLERYE